VSGWGYEVQAVDLDSNLCEFIALSTTKYIHTLIAIHPTNTRPRIPTLPTQAQHRRLSITTALRVYPRVSKHTLTVMLHAPRAPCRTARLQVQPIPPRRFEPRGPFGKVQPSIVTVDALGSEPAEGGLIATLTQSATQDSVKGKESLLALKL
jgi:hypothetical protein